MKIILVYSIKGIVNELFLIEIKITKKKYQLEII